MLMFLLAPVLGAGCAEDPQGGSGSSDLTEVDAAKPAGLEYGLYWFGKGDASAPAEGGEANPFYDPSRPTVIYVHGWQNGATAAGKHETFNYANNDAENGVDIDLADAWVDAGWNIGIFYWTQLADEDKVFDAEAKIWTATGTHGMRWRTTDGGYATEDTPKVSAAELLVDAYTSAMKGQQNPTIRLAGHSLGNQMVVRAEKLLSDRVDAGELPEALLPKRVALLDPFWSNGGKDYLGGAWTGERVRGYVAELVDKGVIFERYKTSRLADLNLADRNTALTALIGETELVPGYISSRNQAARHVAAPNLYFHSFAFAPPIGCAADAGCDGVAPSAATSDETIRDSMKSHAVWKQRAGSETETPEDNEFVLSAQ